MLRIWMSALCLGIVVAGFSQTSGNPFDLKYRKSRDLLPATPVPQMPDTAFKHQNSPVTPSEVKQAPVTDSSVRKDIDTGVNQSLEKTAQDSNSNPFEIKPEEKERIHETFSGDTVVKAPQEEAVVKPAHVRKRIPKGLPIFLILLSLLFLIFIVNVERSYVRDLWRVISNENYSSLHHRNQRNTMRQILLMMGYAIFIIQAGIFLTYTLRLFNYSGKVRFNIWVLMGFVLGVYLLRHLVIRYLRWLFNNQKEMTLFGFDISIFNTMVGLILLPLNILLLFGPDSIAKPLIIIGLIVILAAYALRQLRWLFTARHLITGSLFLFFIYLCAVEILPLWAVSKIFW